MIRFLKLRYKNFLSAGDIFTEIDFISANSTLIVGDNGSGKSTFIDALCFVLYGKPFRQVNKPKLINSITQRGLLVEVEFEIGSFQYLIKRGQKPSLFEIYRGDIDHPDKNLVLINQTSSMIEYQDMLERHILKMSFKAFIQVVILGSTNYVPFMRLSAQSRRDVIEDLLNIQIFSLMNVILREKINANRDSIKDIQGNIAICEHKLELNKKHLEVVEEHRESYIVNRNKLLDGYRTDKGNLQEELKQLKEERNRVYECYVTLEKKRGNLELWGSLLLSIKTNLKKKQEALNSFLVETHCSQCGHQMDDVTRNRMREPKERSIEELKKAIVELKEKIDKENFSSIEHNLVRNNLNDLTFQEAKIEQKINTFSFLILQGETDLIHFQERIKSLDEQTKQMQSLQEEFLVLSQEKSNLLEDKEILDVSTILLKDGGIKTKIIQQYVPIMNDIINKYLEAMEFFISFYLDDNFNETIKSRYRDEFTYENFSEGEKQKINLAILFAWLEIAKMRNSASCNILIMDEILDSSLDLEGTDFLLNLLQDLSKSMNIFVISHKWNMQDKFERVIEFKKNKNFSLIVQ